MHCLWTRVPLGGHVRMGTRLGAQHFSVASSFDTSAPTTLSPQERKAQRMAENRRLLIATLLGKRPSKASAAAAAPLPPPQVSTTAALHLALSHHGVLVDRFGNVFHNPVQTRMAELRGSIPADLVWDRLNEYNHPRPGMFAFTSRLPHNDADDLAIREHYTYLRYGDQPHDITKVPTLEEIQQASSIVYGEGANAPAERKAFGGNSVVLKARKVHGDGSSSAVGRRKTSTAAVQLRPGTGVVLVNNKPYKDYFSSRGERFDDPLATVFSTCGAENKYDIRAYVHGGGFTGQIDALKLAVARALENYEPQNRIPLASAGLMTRDPRMVERKKYGQAKARKRYQWVKR
eukprot:TRINITY_DN854_c0_g1_i1.p1 TRINITY_DN854_c0_g1~~TRINITY_DN854_c0_g1_i1.p1  ORF type:complete len:347 (-),score=71.00 TRINITY_DN854_c0_g1_i1:356-1396(-)